MPSITVSPEIELPDESILHFVAAYYLPGEQVRLDATAMFSGETKVDYAARVALFGDKILTVKETRVDPAPEGRGLLLRYGFQEVAGLHSAQVFMDPRGYEHLYGTLITRNDQPWFVPMDPDLNGACDVIGEPRRVAQELSRSGRYVCGVNDDVLLAHKMFGGTPHPDGTVEQFFAEREAEPWTGELVFHPDGDKLTLGGIPWNSVASPDEVEKAEAAIGTLLETSRQKAPAI